MEAFFFVYGSFVIVALFNLLIYRALCVNVARCFASDHNDDIDLFNVVVPDFCPTCL